MPGVGRKDMIMVSFNHSGMLGELREGASVMRSDHRANTDLTTGMIAERFARIGVDRIAAGEPVA